MRWRQVLLLFLTAAYALSGCVDGGEALGVDSFKWQIIAVQSETTVGGLAHYQVKVIRKSNINHDVELALGAIPVGLVVDLPAKMTSTQETADFTVYVSPGVEDGLYHVEIKAREVAGQSTVFETKEASVVVAGGGNAPDFAIEVSPTTTTPEMDILTFFNFSVSTRNRFYGTVTMALTGLGLTDDVTLGRALTPFTFDFVPGGTPDQGGSFALMYHPIPPVPRSVELVLTATSISPPVTHSRTITLNLLAP